VTDESGCPDFRDELNTYCRNEAPRFLYDSWRQGLIAAGTLRDVIRGPWTQAWPGFSLRWNRIRLATAEQPFQRLDAGVTPTVSKLGKR
jgi:hypothetical protein